MYLNLQHKRGYKGLLILRACYVDAILFTVRLRNNDRNGLFGLFEEVQVGKDQEKAQSGKGSHSKNRGGKKPN